MPDDTKTKTDDFVRLIADEGNQSEKSVIENPFAQDEILFRDENGQIKILKGSQVLKLEGLEKQSLDSSGKIEPQAKEIKEPAVSAVAPLPFGQPLNLEAEVKRIIKKAQLAFSNSDKELRFKNIILARLKDIRDQIETRELFLAAPEFGGMGFDEKTADRILLILNEETEQLNGKLRQAVSRQESLEPFAELRAEAERILGESEPEEQYFPSPPKTSLPPVEKAAAPLPEEEVKAVEQKPVPPLPTISYFPSRPAFGGARPDFIGTSQPPPSPLNLKKPVAVSGEKPKIQDVKFRPRLVGPVEEIASLNIADFRRLASSAKEATEKILEKIQILEEESFSRKIEGIKAWKQSGVYQLYLVVGQQSMAEKLPIAEVIAKRKKDLQPTLTEEDFVAISDLNQKLRH